MTDKNKSSLDNLSDDDIFMSVKELKAYVTEVEMAKAKKSVESMGRAEKAKEELLQRLKSDQPISPERLRAFTLRVKATAEGGQTEMLIGRFPSELCSDHGRAINMAEPDWPETLQGLPRQAYLTWKEKLQPLGYQLKALIVDWPEGVPGDVGLYLSWK
ncbi:hypothetical protein K9U39_02555 [Rhodoblastus acidophilus]|uniref:Uncharacterized protein n=1 Tax=Candidatus Rhodoblastus alkanivorans TaxID=2954117 RepID=A0ABS9Z4C2_9HYPH|nr:hypothetical protein [Candidatus Rhodoblastus alkanivorans]MCI4680674.1 hypothetical protein [Candidatus Rhodoblastus alkanivorans]MCI4682528.1 hypothetical protein [Candidatus Rhodoblastus alkanivorans]MDI4639834.1 hypothetical protein [Rhodoblastus acidophilus]